MDNDDPSGQDVHLTVCKYNQIRGSCFRLNVRATLQCDTSDTTQRSYRESRLHGLDLTFIRSAFSKWVTPLACPCQGSAISRHVIVNLLQDILLYSWCDTSVRKCTTKIPRQCKAQWNPKLPPPDPYGLGLTIKLQG